ALAVRCSIAMPITPNFTIRPVPLAYISATIRQASTTTMRPSPIIFVFRLVHPLSKSSPVGRLQPRPRVVRRGSLAVWVLAARSAQAVGSNRFLHRPVSVGEQVQGELSRRALEKA